LINKPSYFIFCKILCFFFV
jgi:hypothetical protein